MSSNKNSSKSVKSEINTTKEETMKNEKKYAADPIAIAKNHLEAARAAYKELRGVKAPKSPELIEKQKQIKAIRKENKGL